MRSEAQTEAAAVQAVDYYELLGVSRHASAQALRRAFRSKVLLAHPDRNPGDVEACERTRLMVEAYRTLSDPVSRRKYDLAMYGYDSSAACIDVDTTDRLGQRLQWYYAERIPTVDWSRLVLLMVAAALAIALCAAILQVGLSNRPPVFRFQLTESVSALQPQRLVLLVEPNIVHSLELCGALQYQFAAGNDLVEQQIEDVYLNALQRAQRMGNRASEEFYRLSLREINRSKQLWRPLQKESNFVQCVEGPKLPLGSS